MTNTKRAPFHCALDSEFCECRGRNAATTNCKPLQCGDNHAEHCATLGQCTRKFTQTRACMSTMTRERTYAHRPSHALSRLVWAPFPSSTLPQSAERKRLVELQGVQIPRVQQVKGEPGILDHRPAACMMGVAHQVCAMIPIAATLCAHLCGMTTRLVSNHMIRRQSHTQMHSKG